MNTRENTQKKPYINKGIKEIQPKNVNHPIPAASVQHERGVQGRDCEAWAVHRQPEVSLRTWAGLSLCYQEGRHHHHVRDVLLKKNAFFTSRPASKLPPPPIQWNGSKRIF